MTVANITTPANFFHVLRRQLARPFRKPMIVMSPKSLLRHPLCVSDLSEFETETKFHEVFDDTAVNSRNLKKVKKALFCSGKIYYDLLEKKEADKRDDVAVCLLERLTIGMLAHARKDLPALAGQIFSGGPPDAGGCACNDDSFHGVLASPEGLFE